MNYLQKLSLPIAAIGIVVAANVMPASAEEVTTPGSYIGAGASLLTNSGTKLGANIAGRYKLDNVPASVRTSVLLGDGSATVVPTVSYDVPLGDRTNVYLGAGASIPTNDSNSLLGNRTAFALQPGVEVSLNKQLLLYGNAIFSINSFNNGTTGTAVQGGLGYQF